MSTRFALFRDRKGAYTIEEEEFPGSIEKARHAARARGLFRLGGHEDRSLLESWKSKLEAAKS